MIRLLFLLLFFIFESFAIVDIASVDFGEKVKGFSGSAYGSFQKSRGNTNKDEAEYGGRIQYDTNKTITWLQGSAENDKANGTPNADNAFMHLRHIHQIFNPDWAMEFYTQLKQDKFQSLQNRTVFGMGPRYKIADSPTYGKLFMGLSVMDESIRYTDSQIDPTEHNYRASSYLSYKISINRNLEFSYLGYYQPKIDNGSDYMTALTTELMIHLTQVIDLSCQLEFDYDSQPGYDVAKTDTRQKFSFVYRFGKEDPLTSYAYHFLNSTEGLDEANSSSVVAVEVTTKTEEIEHSRDTFAGEWVHGDERFSISLEGEGEYTKRSGVYNEKLTWKLVSTQTQEGSQAAKDQKTKLVIIRFADEEGRPGRVENYLWSGNTLVGLSGTTVRVFKR
jgi:putative salt-induced outer membrane protein